MLSAAAPLPLTVVPTLGPATSPSLEAQYASTSPGASTAICSSAAATLAAPANVKATFAATTNQMQISWSPSPGATLYNVYRGSINNTNAAVCIGSVAYGTTSFVDNSPPPGTTSYYWIRAYSGFVASAFSATATGVDTDRNVVVTKNNYTIDPLLNVINFTTDLVSGINDTLAWDPAPKPGVSGKIDSWNASVVETLIETPSGQIVSGTSQAIESETGEVTGQYSGGIPAFNIATFSMGITVHESVSLTVTESYVASSRSWVVNPSASLLAGSVSATGFGAVTVLGHTGEIDLNVPSACFSGTGSGQVTIAPHVSVTLTDQFNGGAPHTLWQSPTVWLPSWTFNLNDIVIP